MFGTDDTKLCRGCLSADRKLASVSTGDLIMYYFFLAEDKKLDELSMPDINLCWECVGMLLRTQLFQAQVQQAHTILENSLGLPPGKSTLSSLTIQHKLEYDVIIEETGTNDSPLFCKNKVPHITVDKIVIPTKYKAVVTGTEEKNAENTEDVLSFTNAEYKSDDSDDNENDSFNYENVDASDRRSTSPDLTIAKITPQNKIQDVKIVEFQNLKDENPKRKVVKSKRKPIITNKAKNKVKPVVAIVKTPEIVKLELQKLRQNEKKSTTAVQETSKQKKAKKGTVIKSKTAESLSDSAELNVNQDQEETDCDISDDHDDSESSTEEDDSSNYRKGSKTKYKRKKPETDPDFSLGSKIRCKRKKRESDPDFSLEKDEDEDEDDKVPKNNVNDGEEENRRKQKRCKRVIKRFKHIDEVLPYFTEVEMSVDDLKTTVEKEDAIVDEKKPYDCSVCGQRFRLRRSLTYHGKQCHKRTHSEHFKKGDFFSPPATIPDKLWRCIFCTRMLRREHTVAHVNEYHRVRYFCNGEGCEWSLKGFWTQQDHSEHWAAIHKKFACDICGVHKNSKSAVQHHIEEQHLQREWQCRQCDRKFVLRSTLQHHVRAKHGAPTPPEHRYCVECDFTFNSVSNLQIHFYLKHNAARERHVTCTYECRKTTTGSKKKPLPREEPYPCPECGKVLANKATYENHYNLFHKGKTKYRCHICGKFLSNAHALKDHVNTHSNIKVPKTKPCPICGRKFQYNRCLRMHVYTHTGERPYQCTHCPAAYTQPYCLRVHLAKRHGVHRSVRTADRGGTGLSDPNQASTTAETSRVESEK